MTIGVNPKYTISSGSITNAFSDVTFTKRQLIDALDNFPDDAPILVRGLSSPYAYNIISVTDSIRISGEHCYFFEIARNMESVRKQEGK